MKVPVAFVAIKNGQHNGIGYVVDTGAAPGELPARFPLAALPDRIAASLGVSRVPGTNRPIS